MRYLPLSSEDRAEMLRIIGVKSIDDLFVDVPPAARRSGTVDLPAHLGELEVERELAAMAGRNTPAGRFRSSAGRGPIATTCLRAWTTSSSARSS